MYIADELPCNKEIVRIHPLSGQVKEILRVPVSYPIGQIAPYPVGQLGYLCAGFRGFGEQKKTLRKKSPAGDRNHMNSPNATQHLSRSSKEPKRCHLLASRASKEPKRNLALPCALSKLQGN